LFVFIVLHHERRRIVHIGVTAHPTATWIKQQMTEAFPWDTAPRSPWQNPYVERVIGSIRRECLDHVIVLSERHLRRVLHSYLDYYHESRTHLSLNKDSPVPRPIQPAETGKVIAFPQVGGLHHRYERLAA
jgi:transposase InsO family protein